MKRALITELGEKRLEEGELSDLIRFETRGYGWRQRS